MYPLSLRSKTRRRATLLLPTWICSCQSVGTVPLLLHFPVRQSWRFQFPFYKVPFLPSNIPSSPAYCDFISQLIRYARTCSYYECYILRAMGLSNKLLGQGYVKERLKSFRRKFYGRYGDLIKQYEIPLSRMLHDILEDDHLQCHPPLIRHYTHFWPCYWSRPQYRIRLFTSLYEVSIEHL